MTKAATHAAVRQVCLEVFETTFGRKWDFAWAVQLLGDDSLSIRGVLARQARREHEAARKALNALRNRALVAAKAARRAPDDELGALLRAIVAKLPPELVAERAAWKRPWAPSTRRQRVAERAPHIFGRDLEARELAVVGILAGIQPALEAAKGRKAARARQRGEDSVLRVADVLRAEARAYAAHAARRRRRRS